MEQQFIGSYKVLRKIGAGGMAKVYLAVHQDVPNLKVILKILDDPRLSDRFLQEADKLALLDGHPNICRIKHFFSNGDDTVIAMEYIEGLTLDERIKAEGTLPVGEAARIAIAVLDILSFAHSKDVFHRDIKPGNIMLDKHGTVKVIDFGIAKSKTDPNLTVAGTACGTPAYMAPEQFNPTEDTDYALVDVYAVGTTLFVMLTGEAPFKGDNPFAIRDAKMFEDPPRVRSLNPDVSPEMDEIVARAIAKNAAERYQSAAEMAEALSPFADGPVAHRMEPVHKPNDATIDTPMPTIPASSATPPPSKPSGGKSKIGLFAGLGGAVIVVIIAVIWLLAGGDDNNGQNNVNTTTPVATTGVIDFSIKPNSDVYLDDGIIGQATDKILMVVNTGLHAVRVENPTTPEKVIYDTVYVSDTADVVRSYSFSAPAATSQPQSQPTNNRPTQTTAPATVKYGTVVVGSSPKGADIFIDGELQSQKTNFSFNKIEPGNHTIRVVLDDKSADTTFVVKPDGRHKVKFDLD
ncbi:MAG TPA: serine/threonine-protein kinase [candidate division Zixibacteria bacterium]|nr:serine/threonine-protein kinase [candidate division Zixibacteria bacterium]